MDVRIPVGIRVVGGVRIRCGAWVFFLYLAVMLHAHVQWTIVVPPREDEGEDINPC